MAPLVPFYLANVVLYLPSIETVLKFIFINKNCQEAIKIIKIFQPLTLKESDSTKVIPNNLFDIFPNIETIECCLNEINTLIVPQIKQFKLKIIDKFNVKTFNQIVDREIANKTISLDIEVNSINNFHLSDYPKIAKVKLNYLNGGLKEFLGDTNIKLKQLILISYNNTILDCIGEYKGIRSKILILKDKNKMISLERVRQLKSLFTVRTQRFLEFFNINECIGENGLFYLNHTLNIEEIVKNFYFTKCKIEENNYGSKTIKCECDLRKCDYLEILNGLIDQNAVLIKGLSHIKEINFIERIDSIPSSVTKMEITSNFCCQLPLSDNPHCFSNIMKLKYMSCNDGRHDYGITPEVLAKFTNCKGMIIRDDIREISFELPTTLTNLDYCGSLPGDQIVNILELPKLKELALTYSTMWIGNINEKYELLKNCICNNSTLCHLKTNLLSENIHLPSNITSLKVDVATDLDLSQCTNLKRIELFGTGHVYNQLPNVILPVESDFLIIGGKINVQNSFQVNCKQIIIASSFCANLQWKSKNVRVIGELNDINPQQVVTPKKTYSNVCCIV